MRNSLLGLPRRYKRVLQVAADVVLVWVALWLAFFVRLEDINLIQPFGGHGWVFLLAPVVTLPFFVVLGLYRAVLRYVGRHALITIAKAVTLAAAVFLMILVVLPAQQPVVPRSVPVIYWGTALLLLGGLRLVMRHFFIGDWLALPADASKPGLWLEGRAGRPPVAIYGAGSSGNQLLSALRSGRELRPVAFVDDDPSLWNTVVDGVPVYAPEAVGRMLDETGARQVLLAIPSASRQRRRAILDLLDPYPVHVRTLPSFKGLVDGKVKVQDLQEVDIADLLGREPVEPDAALFECCIADQVVMVTGAGGSIGAELCRQIVTSRPRALVLFEHSEFALYSIHTELECFIKERGLAIELVGMLGSVRNGGRMFDTLKAWRVDTVYHAAAYKHVPIVEHNIAQGFFNNTMGTLHAAQAAMRAGVRNFVLISTDKAVRPTNVMGCTKRMAEMVLQALAAEPAPALFREVERGTVPNRTRFTMVRFGNVLGSSGSVIPLFREQIRQGGPITVTDPRITRYFMTIPEAAQLVIQAGSMGEGGDVFVLDMGEPVKIVDLAERIVHLSGLTVRNAKRPDGDIEITFSGLRPGEKLYEELLIGDNVLPTAHPMIMRATEERLPWADLTTGLDAVVLAIKRGDYPAVREVLKLLVSGYTPDERLVDLIYLQRTRQARVSE
ncbi:MAG: nucleoside-diphosphate sugar epimerase/dehydratase [Thauera sp.]